MRQRLVAAALGVVLLTTSARAVEIIDLHSMVTVTDPSNGEQFRLSPQAAGVLARMCGDDVTCLHGTVGWLAKNPPYITLPAFPLARMP
jgi:hypothetical protein